MGIRPTGPFSRAHWSGSTLLLPAEDLAERHIQVIERSGAVTCKAGAMHGGERFGLQVGELFQKRTHYPAIIRMVGPYFATATSARATCSSISGNITSA